MQWRGWIGDGLSSFLVLPCLVGIVGLVVPRILPDLCCTDGLRKGVVRPVLGAGRWPSASRKGHLCCRLQEKWGGEQETEDP